MGTDDSILHFHAADGTELEGDLAVPADVRAAAIVCHPHPQYGGNRFNHVVDTVHRALPAAGVASLRFDFRPQFDGGTGERLDASAALEELRRQTPDVPVLAIGYSFGAMITLGLDDAELSGKVLIAPPLDLVDETTTPTGDVLVIAASDDQFTPGTRAQAIVAAWPACRFRQLDGADHFLAAEADRAADLAVEWIDERLASG